MIYITLIGGPADGKNIALNEPGVLTINVALFAEEKHIMARYELSDDGYYCYKETLPNIPPPQMTMIHVDEIKRFNKKQLKFLLGKWRKNENNHS